MEKTIGIYSIKNIENNKIYVGQADDIRDRWKRHRSELRRNVHHSAHLQSAWNKSGEDSFLFSILETFDDYDIKILNDREAFWMDYFDARNPEHGYNLREAGNRGKPSEETRRKQSAALKGRIITPSHREKISKSKKGIPVSNEAKEKISKSTIGRKKEKRSSELYGVTYDRKREVFIAKIRLLDGKSKYIGESSCEETSGRYYDAYSILNKIEVPLNFPETSKKSLLVYKEKDFKRYKTSTSSYIGVRWSNYYGCWLSTFTYKSKSYTVGKFSTELEAARAYDKYCIKNKIDKVLNFS